VSAKWQKIDIKVPTSLSKKDREAVALEIIDHIRKRADKGIDKNGNKFPGYSEEYIKSLDFKIAGKSKSRVDLQLSGDMLGALDLIKNQSGKITIGFENGSEENARADGNIRGTYGKDRGSKAKARDFLGLPKDEIAQIISQYDEPVKAKKRTRTVNNQAQADVETDDLEPEDG
jgi:hypothetical protein